MLILASAVQTSGQDSLAVSKIASLYDFWGSVNAIEVQGNFAYVTTEPPALWIINISNPASPFIYGKCHFYGEAGKLAIRNGYAYVCAGEDGINIIDVSPPSTPTLISNIGLDGYAVDVEIQDTLMTVITSGEASQPGLFLFNLTDPDAPAPAGQLTGFLGASAVEMINDLILIVDYASGLSIYQYISPGMNLLSETYLEGYPVDLAVSPGKAFIADFGQGIRAFDIQNPAAPWEAGCYQTTNPLFSLIAAGDTVYCCMGSTGIKVIDFTVPSAPVQIGGFNSPGSAYAAYKRYNKVYLADGGKGVEVLTILTPFALQLTGSVDNPGFLGNIEFMDNCAFLADGDFGLRIVDLSQPAAPAEIAVYPFAQAISDLHTAGGLVYLASADTLTILEASNPHNPFMVAHYVFPDYISRLEIWSQYLFAAAEDNIQILNVQNPAQPAFVSQISGLDNLSDIAMQGGLLLAVSMDNCLWAYDLSDIANPALLSQFAGNPSLLISDLEIKDNYAFACGYDEITVYDISDPASIAVMPSIAGFSGVLDLEIIGDHLYIAEYEKVSLFHYLNPTNYNRIGWYDSPGWAMSVTADGINVFLADGFEFGVYNAAAALSVGPKPWNEEIIPTVQLYYPYPNPFNSSTEITYQVNQPGVVDIKIFDLLGQEVSHLYHGFMPQGENRLQWHAENLASGIYFIHLQQNGSRCLQKAVLAK